MPDQIADAPGAEGAAAPTDVAAPEDRADAIAAIVRNGLSNGPIAQSQTTWDHLNIRLPEIADAILKEI